MFWKKPKIIYGPFLKDHRDIIGRQPSFIKKLAEDIDLELYLGDSGSGKNTWVTAVISVKKGKDIFKNKYDGGKLKDLGSIGLALEDMAAECIYHIKHCWGLDGFRKILK